MTGARPCQMMQIAPMLDCPFHLYHIFSLMTLNQRFLLIPVLHQMTGSAPAHAHARPVVSDFAGTLDSVAQLSAGLYLPDCSRSSMSWSTSGFVISRSRLSRHARALAHARALKFEQTDEECRGLLDWLCIMLRKRNVTKTTKERRCVQLRAEDFGRGAPTPTAAQSGGTWECTVSR